MRGKLLCKACRAKSNRITPAGAGKTKLYHLFLSCQPDHPRRCGENFFYRNRKKKVTDHPRRCGENRTTQSGKNYCLGSPPQVRGKRKVSFRKSKALRITPAGAGKTLNKSSIYSKSQDHPRRCGENLTKVNVHTSLLGSPPQVRGKPACRRGSVFLSWITPAGAGKTATVLLAFKAAWDHPRRCGENSTKRRPPSHCQGSPPQVRGKLKYDFTQSKTIGITPAGAGKTQCHTSKYSR